ncbi:MAG: DUF2325 domain-containing protein [Dorea sp.]|nr:DUF2325 domain-containing protein [Dorea sp.]
MNIVIVGGNECMVRQYKELCREYKCKAKIYPKMTKSLKNIGLPDLLVLFTSTVSHKMIRSALEQTKGKPVRTIRSHTSSMNALRGILKDHMAESGEGMYV